MRELIDLTGEQFGRLTVIEEAERRNGNRCWKCCCSCGKIIYADQSNLRSGNTQSCGCRQRDIARKTQYKHGLHKTKLWYVHQGMKERCTNPDNKQYSAYGGRGITVCSEWMGEDGFLNFYNWAMGNGYAAGLSIDRINNDEGYSPDNCRWVTAKIQNRNKRNNYKLTIDGKQRLVIDWSELTGIKYNTLLHHYHMGDAVKYIENHIFDSIDSLWRFIGARNALQDFIARCTTRCKWKKYRFYDKMGQVQTLKYMLPGHYSFDNRSLLKGIATSDGELFTA